MTAQRSTGLNSGAVTTLVAQVLPTAKEPPKPPSVWVALPSEDANLEQWSTPATYFAGVIRHLASHLLGNAVACPHVGSLPADRLSALGTGAPHPRRRTQKQPPARRRLCQEGRQGVRSRRGDR